MYIYIHVYIYICRERERERDRGTVGCVGCRGEHDDVGRRGLQFDHFALVKLVPGQHWCVLRRADGGLCKRGNPASVCGTCSGKGVGQPRFLSLSPPVSPARNNTRHRAVLGIRSKQRGRCVTLRRGLWRRADCGFCHRGRGGGRGRAKEREGGRDNRLRALTCCQNTCCGSGGGADLPRAPRFCLAPPRRRTARVEG